MLNCTILASDVLSKNAAVVTGFGIQHLTSAMKVCQGCGHYGAQNILVARVQTHLDHTGRILWGGFEPPCGTHQ
jgi:hypothetical protein